MDNILLDSMKKCLRQQAVQSRTIISYWLIRHNGTQSCTHIVVTLSTTSQFNETRWTTGVVLEDSTILTCIDFRRMSQ